MGICRLCLESVEGAGIPKPEETIQLLQTFLPNMNRTLINMPVICGTCFEYVTASHKLLENKKKTDSKILVERRRLKVAKLDLESFCKNLPENFAVCRVCLNLINRPRIFLYENSTNLLSHDFIKVMMNFCNLKMNLEVTNKPVMCLKCWELLQIAYTFKKGYLEVERKMRQYCSDFKIRNRKVSLETLQNVRDYFSEDYCKIIKAGIKQENTFVENICAPKEEEYIPPIIPRRIRRVKKEKVIKKEEFPDVSFPHKRRKPVRFNKTDNITLMRVYYEVTNNEQDFHKGYWKRLYDKWIEVKPDKPVPGGRLSVQIHKIVREKLLSKVQLDKIKAEISAKIKVQTQSDETAERYSDSDDSFTEEAVHSSFTPHIKSEPLSESDIEIEYIEPKLEVESDCESLPQLERMDLPPLIFKIENIYSLGLKREAFDNFIQQEESKITTEDINKSRRDSLRVRNKDKEPFECTECNFKTTDKSSADRHTRLHQRRNQKIHQCTSCSYRIASKWLLARHMKKHKAEEDEIPVLLPDALITR